MAFSPLRQFPLRELFASSSCYSHQILGFFIWGTRHTPSDLWFRWIKNRSVRGEVRRQKPSDMATTDSIDIVASFVTAIVVRFCSFPLKIFKKTRSDPYHFWTSVLQRQSGNCWKIIRPVEHPLLSKNRKSWFRKNNNLELKNGFYENTLDALKQIYFFMKLCFCQAGHTGYFF